jgi:hypothetical protein
MRMNFTTKLSDTQVVQTWWNRQSKNYVSQLKNADGNPIGEPLFANVPATAKSNHDMLVDDLQSKSAPPRPTVRGVRI